MAKTHADPISRDRVVRRHGRMMLWLLMALLWGQGAGWAQGGKTEADKKGAATAAGDRTHVIIGRVVDSQGRPVVGALVAARLEKPVPVQEVPQPAITNRSGEFSLTRLGPGMKTLKVIKRSEYKDAEFEALVDTVDFTAVLKTVYEEGSRLRVRLVDEFGRPAVQARLRVRRWVYYLDRNKDSWLELRTDARGVAECDFKPDAIPDIKAGKPYAGFYTVIVDTPGYAWAFIQRSLHRDCDETLVLRPAGPCWSGRVVDAKGAPIAGARVSVNTWTGEGGVRSGGLNHEPYFTYSSDAQGYFELTRFNRKDMITAEISAPLHAPVTAFFDPETGYTYVGGMPAGRKAERNTGGVFRLAPGGDIVGRLVDKAGRPLRMSFRVDLVGKLPISSAPPITRWTTTTAEGTFTFEGVTPFNQAFPMERFTAQEKVKIKPEHRGWQLSFDSLSPDPKERKCIWAEPRAVDVRIGETMRIDVRMVEGIPVEGKVVNVISGEPYLSCVIGRISRPGVAFEDFVPVEEMTGLWRTWLAPGAYECYFYSISGPRLVETPRTMTVTPGGRVDLGTIAVSER